MNKKVRDFAIKSQIVYELNGVLISSHMTEPEINNYLQDFAKYLIDDVLRTVFDEVQYETSHDMANSIVESVKKHYI